MNTSLVTDTQIKKFIKECIKNKRDASKPLLAHKGLEVRVRVKGKFANVTFRHRYAHPFNGKRPYMTLGEYPYITLLQAKEKYYENRSLLSQSIDPMAHRDQQHQLSVEQYNSVNT